MKIKAIPAALLSLGLVGPAFSQAVSVTQAPDAGRLGRDAVEPLSPPKPTQGLGPLPSSLNRVPAGGASAAVASIKFKGNTVISEEDLQEFARQFLGKSYDLAGIYGIADSVSQFYRDEGYFFAKVLVPEGAIKRGELVLEVVEGRYGQIRVSGATTEENRSVESYLSEFKRDQVIYGPDLARQILLINDLPGQTISPVIKPSEEVGQGDLDVRVEPTDRFAGSVGLNNHGNRYTGYHQVRGNFVGNSLLAFGDQLQFVGLKSDGDLEFAALNYSLPLGVSGLRGTVGYSNTDYKLGRDFSNLQASGDAQVSNIGLSYPIIRSRKANLTASVIHYEKEFHDEQRAVNVSVDRSSNSNALVMNFDRQHDAALTYGQIEYLSGDFNGPAANTARTNGSFTRISYELAHLHLLPADFSMFVRLNGQVARDNLDSSESFSLGGPNAVRAYPTGEANGDEGYIAQIELRYRVDKAWSPFIFYDMGEIKVEHSQTAAGTNQRGLSGAGVGVRYEQGPFRAEATVAARTSGGPALSDPGTDSLVGWFSLSYSF